jgi:hypothetical protein
MKICRHVQLFSYEKPLFIPGWMISAPLIKILCFLAFMAGSCISLPAQRTYKQSSVLSSGSWYKISVNRPGVYKIDVPFLNNLGINTASLPSASIRLYGNGGKMLSESNSGFWVDDLTENAILVVDGGDGLLNGSDYILFYADGPDEWIPDAAQQKFIHRKNLYSDRAYYFITIGGQGKRMTPQPAPGTPNIQVTSFSERYFHESEMVNFLNSGKEWYGEEFANAPGKSLSRNFTINIPGIQSASGMEVVAQCVSRSVGATGSFQVSLNNSVLGQINIPPVSGGQYDLFAQQGTASFFVPTAPAGNINLGLAYTPGSFNAQGWLNWFRLFFRRNLSMPGNDLLLFRDWQSVGIGLAGEFIIGNASSNVRVWDITDPLNPVSMQTVFSGNETRFVNDCSVLREYVAFNPAFARIPAVHGRIQNQDLHNSGPKDYLIITHTSLLPQAQRLAQFHEQKSGLRTFVVTTDQVFNEFSGGCPDPAALRNFIKMYYDKYGYNAADKLKYVLLFGAASFDYQDRLAGNTNLVPAYQSPSSLDPLATYTSDDFFGFLDDHEDIQTGFIINDLDVAIGRLPARSSEEAKSFVDKLERYYQPQGFGPWRNDITIIADDEDNNLHLQDAEVFAQTVQSASGVFNIRKIYLDAYWQETGPGGSRYPQANLAVNNQIFHGTLIWNYTGHGGPQRLAEESILDQSIINSWNNATRLPLFVTATCDFAPYDNPAIHSIGLNILLRPQTGGIALVTTTRAVFAFSNRILNNNFLQMALQPDASGNYRTLGEAVREAKNFTYQTSGDVINNRKFTLLGDPAMRLAFPEHKINITKVNGHPGTYQDTLRATDKVVIEGEITDRLGNLLNGFNGYVYPSVYDKPRIVQTLANDPSSQVVGFSSQTDLLFKGKATVNNGRFSFSFKMPKDINYHYGPGKLSLYAADGEKDASGFFSSFIVGGVGNQGSAADNEGPDIKAYLNDEKFVNGGLSNQTPVLIVKLYDSSGINISGSGIGHDIVAVLDNDNQKFFILNDFYQAEADNYQRGVIRFQLPELEPGSHTIKIKAWDVMNNSSEYVLEFVVGVDDELVISRVLNYPNPFTTNTYFWFEHNKPSQDLNVKIQIFTLAGRLIKQIEKTINSPGNRSNELSWDGKDDYGDKVGKGIYLYKLGVSQPGGKKKEKIEKLVIF